MKAGDPVDKNQDQRQHMLQRDQYTIMHIIDTRDGKNTSYDVSLKFSIPTDPKDSNQEIS